MHRFLLFAAVQAVAAAPALANDKPVIAPPAKWVTPRSLPDETGPDDGAALRVLLNDQQLHFGAEGDSFYTETVVRIQTAQGLAPMGYFALRWKPETDVVTVHKYRILRGKEVIDLLAKGPGFTILRREDNLEYAALDGALTATIQPEGLQVGDIVDIAFTMQRADPLLHGHSDRIIVSRFPAPMARIIVNASWPQSKAMRLRPIDPPATPALDMAKGTLALDATKVAPIVNPKGAPPRFQIAGQIEFSDFASWAEVAAIFAPLYDTARTLRADSPLKAEIAKIAASSADPGRRAEQALALVQDKLRYVFLGMNDGHLRPADADTSWQRRFGDCKAKTALLLALLDGLGIRAEPALVSVGAGDGLDERLPAVGLFDHVIVRATIGDKVYWLDGTRSGDTSLARLRVPDFHWALPLRARSARLEPLVVPPFDEPQERVEVRLDATAGLTTPAKAHIEAVMAGDDALVWRYQLANLQPADLDRALREYWKGRYDFITPTTVSARFEENDATEHLVMDGSAKLDWNPGHGGYYEVDGARLGWRPDYDREPGPNREAPFATSYPGYSLRRETILLPATSKGFWIDGKDVDKTLGGYQFKRRTTIVGNLLTMEASTRSLVPEISFADAQKAIEPLRELAKRGVYVQAPPNVALASTRTEPAAPALPPAKVHLNKAETLLNGGDADQAMTEANEATRLDPAMAGAFAVRARIYQLRNKPRDAAAEGEALIKVNAKDAGALAVAGAIFCNAGRQPDGIDAFGRSLSIAPDQNAYLGRARCRPIGDVAGRRADIDAALKLNPKSSSGLTMLSRLQREQGDHAGEIASLATLSSLDARNLFAMATLGGAYARAGQGERARATFATVRGQALKNAYLLNLLCWEAAVANFDVDQAHTDCKAALAVQAEYGPALDSLGLVLLRLHRYDEAIAAYDAALKVTPSQASALYGRGLARRGKGTTSSGDTDMAAARAIKPDIDATFASYGFAGR